MAPERSELTTSNGGGTFKRHTEGPDCRRVVESIIRFLKSTLGLSTDIVDEHRRWIEDVNDTQNTTLTFPIIADADLSVARMYDTIHPGQSESAAVRSVFIIDPAMKIRLMMTYPMSVGRNFNEILRVIDALQLGDQAHRDAGRLEEGR